MKRYSTDRCPTPECNLEDLVDDNIEGNRSCPTCGVVVAERIVAEDEYVLGGWKNYVGTPITKPTKSTKRNMTPTPITKKSKKKAKNYYCYYF